MQTKNKPKNKEEPNFGGCILMALCKSITTTPNYNYVVEINGSPKLLFELFFLGVSHS